jgi:predicted aspartyl protease
MTSNSQLAAPFSGLSRRGLIASGAASLATISFGARGQSVPNENRTAIPLGAQYVLTVEVALDGAGPFRFVVDTGADRSVLSEEAADKLKLVRGRQVAVAGIARTVVTDTVHLGNFAIGGVTRQDLDIPVLPGLIADGYAGLDLIDNHRVVFDFRNRTLTLGAPDISYLAEIVKPDESLIRAGGSQGHLRTVNCEVEGVRAVAFLDTGADISVGNSRLLKSLAADRDTPVATETIVLKGVTGGSVAGRTIAVEKIRLGDYALSTDGMAIADLPIFDLWGLTDTPALFIGMDFLSRFSRVSIDYGLKQYRLEIANLEVAEPRISAARIRSTS